MQNIFEDDEIDRTPEQVAGMVANGAQLIDVREPHERSAGHIEGSRHIEIERLGGKASTIDRDRAVIFQCRLGIRAGLAAHAFRSVGYDAYNLKGGIAGWVADDRPIEGTVVDH